MRYNKNIFNLKPGENYWKKLKIWQEQDLSRDHATKLLGQNWDLNLSKFETVEKHVIKSILSNDKHYFFDLYRAAYLKIIPDNYQPTEYKIILKQLKRCRSIEALKLDAHANEIRFNGSKYNQQFTVKPIDYHGNTWFINSYGQKFSFELVANTALELIYKLSKHSFIKHEYLPLFINAIKPKISANQLIINHE